jgi:RecB family exonuclease
VLKDDGVWRASTRHDGDAAGCDSAIKAPGDARVSGGREAEDRGGHDARVCADGLLAHGGFEGAKGPVTPDELTYVRVVGRKTAGEVITRASGAEAADLAQAALEGLKRRVARFDDENTPYVSWAAPQFMGNQGGNYDHLARVWEWSVIGDGDEE